jgi:hypothetical protein
MSVVYFHRGSMLKWIALSCGGRGLLQMFPFSSSTTPSRLRSGSHGGNCKEHGLFGLTPLSLERTRLSEVHLTSVFCLPSDFSGSLLGLPSALKMLTICPSYVSNSVRTTQRYSPEDRTPQHLKPSAKSWPFFTNMHTRQMNFSFAWQRRRRALL